jgi:hypothetical protein
MAALPLTAGMSARWFAEADERRSFSGILLMSPLSFVSAEASVDGAPVRMAAARSAASSR